MFEKRLFSLVPEATPYIVASVACKWLALLANVAVMWMLATLLEGALAGAAASLVPLAPWLAAAILVRATAIYLAQRAGELVERGMHGQLLRASGVYARMWESQESLSAYASAPEAVDGEILAEEAAAPSGVAPSGAEPRGARRSGLSVMLRMMGLVRPLAGWLVLAVLLGSVGMLAAMLVPALGACGLMSAACGWQGLGLAGACVLCALCGVVRGPLHYGEQLCNHYIAFRLLAHVRDLVFGALRTLAPAKLEGRGKGDVVSLVTSDIELLEVFYAHTISPIAIAIVCVAVMFVLIGRVSGVMALVALASYALLGVLMPLVASRASEGVVRVSGRDVRRVNTASLRACEAYMTQDTHLFTGTLGDNLRVARADATGEQIDAACEAASLDGLIARLPQGYDTPVAELGGSLSSGERQRLGLARVFLSDAPLVLLDEPTSALDALSEATVMRSVARLRERGKTVVLVSHRASTCAFADRFVSVEHGRVS